MVRKQLYILEAQDRALKAAAHTLAVTEAEVVRRALDAFLSTTAGGESSDALSAMLSEAAVIAASHRLQGSFDRAELYERAG
jgi:hypothetical protein